MKTQCDDVTHMRERVFIIGVIDTQVNVDGQLHVASR